MVDVPYFPGDVVDFPIIGKQDRIKLRTQLRSRARSRKTILIVPVLASEFSDPENRPVFENILANLRQIAYLHRIIFGLDGAGKKEADDLHGLIAKHGLKNHLIQWNHGPVFSEVYKTLSEAGFGFTEEGKGKNMFLGFGLAMALEAQCVGLIDADIRSFDRIQVDRLLFPVVAAGYDFSKAYYTRVSQGRLFGRVRRLLLTPLLLALRRRFTEVGEEKILGIIEFLLSFRYPLSGEVAFEHELLQKMRFATNWGVEIFTLIEVYRKASSVAQVEFTRSAFDHKHQDLSPNDDTRGLNRMAVDITTTLLNTLVREEGLEISENFFRDLVVTYKDAAEQMIKVYSEQAAFNSLDYDRDLEEDMVHQVFSMSILRAGELMTSQSRLTQNFLRAIHTYPEFKPFLEAGLADAILAVETKLERSIFEIPQTVSWERVHDKLPGIFQDLKNAAREETRRFS